MKTVFYKGDEYSVNEELDGYYNLSGIGWVKKSECTTSFWQTTVKVWQLVAIVGMFGIGWFLLQIF